MKINYRINQDKIIKPGDWVIYIHHTDEPTAYLVDKVGKDGIILLRYDRLLGYALHNSPAKEFQVAKVKYGNPDINYNSSDEKLYKRRLNENKL